MNDVAQQPEIEQPKKRRGRQPGSKNKVDGKKLREIAAGARKPKAGDPLAQLIAAGRLLRAAVKDRVDAYEDDELLAAALSMHEAAERAVA